MTTTPTYLFYDLETSGLNPCFDQVMQFAAIRTDLALNEIERYEWLVQLKPENIANPYAIITTGLLPEHCQQGKTEYQSILDIHKLLNEPGTISGGYNTLGFDDTFLRFSFFRHLLTPYTHQFKNDCGRFDLYPISILFYLYSDINIQWPTVDNKISMKLENLNAANKLATGKAHEAMCDVEATLALARIFQQDEKRFDYAMQFFNKKTDIRRTNQITTPMYIALEGKLGAKNQFHSLVIPLGQHQHYTNQSVWLCLDTVDFADIPAAELTEKTYCLKKRGGEAPLLLPALERFLQKTPSKRQTLAEKNLEWLHSNPKEAAMLKTHYQTEQYPVIKNADSFAQLYQSDFPNYHDSHLMQTFHQSTAAEKLQLTDQFDNKLYQLLGQRLCQHGTIYDNYVKQRLGIDHNTPIDYQNKPALTLPKALELCQDILANPQTHTADQLHLCTQYADYLKQLSQSKVAA